MSLAIACASSFFVFQYGFDYALEEFHVRNVDDWNLDALVNFIEFLVLWTSCVADLAYGELFVLDFVFEGFVVDFEAKQVAVYPVDSADAVGCGAPCCVFN